MSMEMKTMKMIRTLAYSSLSSSTPTNSKNHHKLTKMRTMEKKITRKLSRIIRKTISSSKQVLMNKRNLDNTILTITQRGRLDTKEKGTQITTAEEVTTIEGTEEVEATTEATITEATEVVGTRKDIRIKGIKKVTRKRL